MVVSDAAKQLREDKKAEALATAAFAVYPVYAFVDEYAEPVLTGTCFAIGYRERRFLLTAAHVFDDHKKAILAIGIPGREELLIIEGQFHYTSPGQKPREEDPFDFAWHELTESEVKAIPCIPEVDLEDILSSEPGVGVYVAIGYPVSKNKKISPEDRKSRRVVPKMATYMNLEANDSKYFQSRGMSAETHIAIRRENRAIDDEGKEVNTLGHKGLSGGPLVNTGLRLVASKPPTIHASRVSGILLEKDEKHKIIVALRLSVVLRHIDTIVTQSSQPASSAEN